MVVADLHIGIEHELRRSGMTVFSQTPKTLEHLEELIRSNDISHLIVNGDLKHNVPSSPWETRRREAGQVLDGLGRKIDELSGLREKLMAVPGRERDETHEAELRRVERRLSYYRFRFVRERDERMEYSPQEDREIPWILEKLAGLVKRVDMIKGNHDGSLEQYLPRYPAREGTVGNGDAAVRVAADSSGGAGSSRMEIHPPRGVVFDEVGIFHGHTWPSDEVMASRFIVVAHNHPSVVLTDEVGARMREACWLRMNVLPAAKERYPGYREDAEIMVMPAFDRFKKGIPVNTRNSVLLGPIFRGGLADISTARVYLLDGLDMGTVEALRPLAYGDLR